MESILIVDPDNAVSSNLREQLAAHDLDLALMGSEFNIVETCQNSQFNLIVINVTLASRDGFDTIRQLRRVTDVPVILLTASPHIEDAISGLECGADDYLLTPVNPREMVARIRAVLRRRSPQFISTSAKTLAVDGFQLNAFARTAYYRDNPLPLTSGEFTLLQALLESPGVVVPRECLSDRLYRRPFHPLDRKLDVLVSRLRRKLNLENSPGEAIRTIRGAGYVFALNPAPATLRKAV